MWCESNRVATHVDRGPGFTHNWKPQPPVSAPEKCPDLTPEVKKLFHYSKRLADYVRLWMENGLNAGKIGDESGNSLWVPYRDLMEELKAFANADKEKL